MRKLFKFKSIKSKMILAFASFIFIIIAGASFFFFNQARGVLQDALFSTAETAANLSARAVNVWIEQEKVELDIMAKSSDVQSMDWTQQEEYLRKIAESSDEINAIFVADRNGNARVTHGNDSNIRDRDYFQEVINTARPTVSDVIVSRANNQHIVVIAHPIINNNRTVGVIGSLVDLAYLQGLVSEMNINGYGHGWIVDQNMITVAHPDEDLIGSAYHFDEDDQEFQLILNDMISANSDVAFYDRNGIRSGIAYAPIESANWSIALSAELGDILEGINIMQRMTFIIGLIAIVLAIVFTYLVSRIISKPIIKLSEISEKIAAGDLSVNSEELDDYISKDEIGLLASSSKKMHNNLKSMITQLMVTAENVSATSEELHASGEQVGEVAEQVSSSIENVAAGAEEQSAQVEESVNVINDLIKRISNVEKSSVEMNKFADSVIERIDRSGDIVDDSINKVKVVKKDTSEVAGFINQLGKASEEIGNIVEIINNIASQTNLLALNAAIEAARAGEAGSGFSVVAEEIRVLAEDSAKATDKIADLINQIQSNVRIVNGKMITNIDDVDQSVSNIENMGMEFIQVRAVTYKLKKIIDNVSNNAQEMAENSNMVESAISSIASVSEDFAGNAQEVAASSEEQVAATEEIVSSSGHLADLAQKLNETVHKFKLNNSQIQEDIEDKVKKN
ncbi:methyl-accepting chemotaxis protein [Natronospora cellulosivora (SeqCode)]